MIIDSSALLAILLAEPDAARYAEAISGAEVCRISAASYLETALVIESNTGPAGAQQLDALIRVAEVQIEAVTVDQVMIARQAWRDFGRGQGHPARLNFGDCFSYALARATGESLLFKGDDFARTDIPAALTR